MERSSSRSPLYTAQVSAPPAALDLFIHLSAHLHLTWHAMMLRTSLLFLALGALLATASGLDHNEPRDPREHMYLAPGTRPTKRYIGKRATSECATDADVDMK